MTNIRIAVATDGLTVGYEPHESAYHHTDVDGDRLLISTALVQTEDGGEPGIYFRTDPIGSSVLVSDLPALITQLQVIAAASVQDMVEEQ